MANRLSGERSPYLLQHKDNPVDWYPWGEEAFERARAEDRPVFLSIGYSSCHWCHVMARESFEDEETARLLNEFVCIKVDREERPDIDSLYMAVCQALTGSGGWPLTVFLTPDQKPFFAGTYFPPTARGNQPGLRDILQRTLRLWKTDRENLLEAGNHLTTFLQRDRSEESATPDASLLEEACRQLSSSYDPVWGGFGEAPKFPSAHTLLFLLESPEPDALLMAERTLQTMAAGGIQDQIGGGFCRYSTDRMWQIPHFEKMLYDNALLLLAYTEAFRKTGNSLYRDTTIRTADFVLRELRSPEGAFWCSQDADSGGEEGRYYAFIPEEILHALGPEDGAAFNRLYGVTAWGNFYGRSVPNRIGQEEPGWAPRDPRLEKLRSYRSERSSLTTDRKVLLGWNAWMILALTRDGCVLEEERYLDAARTACGFLRERMTDPEGNLLHSFYEGEAHLPAQLDDYAVWILALLELHHADQDVGFLAEAVHHARRMLERFEDRDHGGFFLTAHDAPRLIARPKEVYDGAMPSGNSAAGMALLRLARLTADPLFQEASDRQLSFLAGQAQSVPTGCCYGLLAISESLSPHRDLMCTAPRVPEELLARIRPAGSGNLSVLCRTPDNAEALEEIAPFTRNYPLTEEPVYYLCENQSCLAPERDLARLPL